MKTVNVKLITNPKWKTKEILVDDKWYVNLYVMNQDLTPGKHKIQYTDIGSDKVSTRTIDVPEGVEDQVNEKIKTHEYTQGYIDFTKLILDKLSFKVDMEKVPKVTRVTYKNIEKNKETELNLNEQTGVYTVVVDGIDDVINVYGGNDGRLLDANDMNFTRFATTKFTVKESVEGKWECGNGSKYSHDVRPGYTKMYVHTTSENLPGYKVESWKVEPASLKPYVNVNGNGIIEKNHSSVDFDTPLEGFIDAIPNDGGMHVKDAKFILTWSNGDVTTTTIEEIRVVNERANLEIEGTSKDALTYVKQWVLKHLKGDTTKNWEGMVKYANVRNVERFDLSYRANGYETFDDQMLVAEKFNMDLSRWETPKLDSLRGTFEGLLIFNQPLDGWDVSKADQMKFTFQCTPRFNQPLNNWNVHGNATSMLYMFNGSGTFIVKDHLTNDLAKVDAMNSRLGSPLVKIHEPKNDRYQYHTKQMDFNQDLDKWDVSGCVEFSYAFSCVRGIHKFDGKINGWDFGGGVFRMFYNCEFNQPMNNCKVGNIWATKMFEKAFNFNQPLSNWNTSAIKGYSNMFDGASSFNQNISNWSISGYGETTNFHKDCPLKQSFCPPSLW